MSDAPEIPEPDQTYDEWLATYDRRKWIDDLQSVAVDVVVFSADDVGIKTYLMRRVEHPEYRRWVLPGGFVRGKDRLDPTAERVVRDKVRIVSRIDLERLRFFDDPRRDARTRTFSMGYVTRCPADRFPPTDGVLSRAAYLDGYKLRGQDGEHLTLGFDHDEIVATAIDHAKRAITADVLWPVALVSRNRFTIAQLQNVREWFGLPITTDALRRLVTADPRVSRAGWVDQGTGKPANAYKVAPLGRI